MGSWSRVGHPTTIPDGVDGLPHNHVITVRNRRISIDDANLVQNNVRTDTITLDLDSDWDGLGITVNLGECPSPFPLIWEGSPLTIPAAACAEVGGVDVSIVGVSSDGKTQVVTVESNNAFKVEKSGCVTSGDLPEDPTSLLGQVLAAAENANEAAESADTAATSANSAATAATSAAQSANAAATSATTAASNATSAASSANSAANAANAAAQTAIDAAESVTGNVLVGQTGEADVASGSGAWGAKPRRLAVYGNTRQNLWVNPSGTRNGVTVTANADGSLTLSGTSTAEAISSIASYVLRPGSTYTASISASMSGGTCASVHEYSASNVNLAYHDFGLSSSSLRTTFTVDESCVKVAFVVYVPSGTTVSGTYRVMLNEGSEAQPWCPPGLNSVGDDGSVDIVTAGKNLLERLGPSLPYTTAGVTFSDNGDGGIRIVGTASGAAYFNFFSEQQAPSISAGTYTASLAGKVDGVGLTVGVFDYEIGGTYTSWISDGITTPTTGTLDSPKYLRPYLLVTGGITVDTVVYPQLELGSAATDYEPPNITTTPIDLQGHTLNALPDGTRDELVIEADGTCAIEKNIVVATVTSVAKLNGTTPFVHFIAMLTPIARSLAYCDRLPIGTGIGQCHIAGGGNLYIRPPESLGITTWQQMNEWLADNPLTVVYSPVSSQSDTQLDAVTLPALPETFNVYIVPNANGVPATLEVEYERDVTKAIGGLEARVAALEEAK